MNFSRPSPYNFKYHKQVSNLLPPPTGAAKETGQLTPERVLQESVKESQRMKLAELESERSRSEESDRRKEEERSVKGVRLGEPIW